MSGYFGFLLLGHLLAGSFVYGEEFDKCVQIFNPENMEMKCCESMNQLSGVWKDCATDSKYDCKAAECVLQKIGIMTDDQINEDTARSQLDKWGQAHEDEKDMTERVKQFCLDSQYEDYGVTDDTCSPIKFHICTYINSIVVCTKWKETDSCKKVAQLANECKKALDEAK